MKLTNKQLAIQEYFGNLDIPPSAAAHAAFAAGFEYGRKEGTKEGQRTVAREALQENIELRQLIKEHVRTTADILEAIVSKPEPTTPAPDPSMGEDKPYFMKWHNGGPVGSYSALADLFRNVDFSPVDLKAADTSQPDDQPTTTDSEGYVIVLDIGQATGEANFGEYIRKALARHLKQHPTRGE